MNATAPKVTSWTHTDSVTGQVTSHSNPVDQWLAIRAAIGAPAAPKVEPWATRQPAETKAA